MSVIPQEDSLVMSFADAQRVFQSIPEGEVAADEYTAGGRRGSETIGILPPAPRLLARQSTGMVDVRNPRGQHILDHTEPETEDYYNPIFSMRARLRPYLAEGLGTFILVLWGEGTQAQVVAARKTPNDYLSVSFGWGVGFLLALYVSSGISGGHINPAVTITLAVFRGFSWRKVPGYIVAQLIGAFVAAAVIFGVYYGPLHSLPMAEWQGVMVTGPSALTQSVASTFFSVFTGAALLMGAICAFTDTGNNPATPGLTPLLLGFIMIGIASSFGYQTGFVLNPARDMGPRLLLWAAGVGRQIWTENSYYGIWLPTAATIPGAMFAALVYDLLIYNGRDSPVNFNFRRHRKAPARPLSDSNMSQRTAVHGTHRGNKDPKELV